LAQWTIRKVQTTEAIAMIAMQFAGAAASWKLFEYLTNRELANIAGTGFDWRVLTAEAVGAFVLTYLIVAAYDKVADERQRATAVGVGMFLGVLVASVASNALVNPALAIGAQSVSRAYLVGPLLGALVGANLYALLFAPAPVRRRAASSATARKTTARKTTRRTTTKRRTRR
jgi:glycerol uptake facilitator-like aquaporin